MSIICYSLKTTDDIYCKFLAETRPDNAVEVRLDTCELSRDEIREIFSLERSSFLIAGFDCQYPSQATKGVEDLSYAILCGADYVDLGSGIPEAQRRWLISLAMNRGCKVILSYRNRMSTPDKERLNEFIDKSRLMGADIVKVVTAARSKEDADIITSLYEDYPPEILVAYATGEEGVNTRLLSYSKGAPLFYISPCREMSEVKDEEKNFTYFDFVREESVILSGTVDVPSSNFIFQRTIILAALSEGTTNIYGVSLSEESVAALTVAHQLNAEIKVDKGVISITGHQNINENGLVVNGNLLFIGGSLSLAHLCIPLAALSRKPVTLISEETLHQYKLNQYRAALKQLGVILKYTDNYYLPVTVEGPIHGGLIRVNGEHSPEMLSSLITVLSLCDEPSFVSIENLTDPYTLDLSSTIGTYFGLVDPSYPENDDETSRTYTVIGGQHPRSTKGIDVEKDWNFASFFLVAGAMMGDITVLGLDIFSEQTDSVIFDFLEQCRVDIKKKDNTINIRKSIICPFVFDLKEASDMFAPLLLLALRADGESCISGIKSLKSREARRVRDFLQEFRRLGANIHIEGDNMYICGEDSLMLKGGQCSSHADPLLAMSLTIASFMSKKKVEIDDVECIDNFFPTFMENIEKLIRSKK